MSISNAYHGVECHLSNSPRSSCCNSYAVPTGSSLIMMYVKPLQAWGQRSERLMAHMSTNLANRISGSNEIHLQALLTFSTASFFDMVSSIDAIGIYLAETSFHFFRSTTLPISIFLMCPSDALFQLPAVLGYSNSDQRPAVDKFCQERRLSMFP